MPKKNLTVVAKIKAKKDKIEEVKKALLALVHPTHQEEGCIDYDLHQSNSDPSLFIFYEKWTNDDALEAHLGSPHLQAFVQQASDMLEEEVEINLLTQISETRLSETPLQEPLK